MLDREMQPDNSEVSDDITSPWRRRMIRLGAYAAGASLIALPFATVQSLRNARAQDESVVIPAMLTFSPGGSSVNLGPLGSFYNNAKVRHWHKSNC